MWFCFQVVNCRLFLIGLYLLLTTVGQPPCIRNHISCRIINFFHETTHYSTSGISLFIRFVLYVFSASHHKVENVCSSVEITFQWSAEFLVGTASLQL